MPTQSTARKIVVAYSAPNQPARKRRGNHHRYDPVETPRNYHSCMAASHKLREIPELRQQQNVVFLDD